MTTTKDGVTLKVGNIPIPEKMYFYERSNGTVFNVSEKDAIKIHTKFKFRGVSDGQAYVETIKQLQKDFQTLTMEEIRAGMLKAWDDELARAANDLTPPTLRPLNLGLKDQINFKVQKDEIR